MNGLDQFSFFELSSNPEKNNFKVKIILHLCKFINKIYVYKYICGLKSVCAC